MTAALQNVLLIDDERLDQRQYKRVLTQSAHVNNVASFSYADEALEHMKAHPNKRYDVIFLDINLPRMSGFEFLEQGIRELGDWFSTHAVVLITTSLNPSDSERARGFDMIKLVLNKPLKTEDVDQVKAAVCA